MYVRKLIKECKMSNIIKIDNLNKSYGSIKAVNNLSFRVKDGELFSFLITFFAGSHKRFLLLAKILPITITSGFSKSITTESPRPKYSPHIR